MKPNRFVDAFVRMFGDLKFFKIPPVIVYDPSSYRVKGKDMREVMDAIEPGDILVRGYLGYVDGWIIPGYFSHAGLYLGEVKEEERARCSELERSRDRFTRRTRRKPRAPDDQFAVGEQMVVHALAEGVLVEDLLNFCRCDYMAVLRLPDELRTAGPSRAVEGLSAEEARIQARLLAGQTVSRAEAVAAMRDVALSKVGYPYDTTFDFTDFKRLSCTEFVYFVTRCLWSALDVVPRRRWVFVKHQTIISPDDYVSSKVLGDVWASDSVDCRRWKELRPAARKPVPAAKAQRVA